MVDCRWLTFWGVGRVTRLLLQGLAEEPPDGRWVLWGGPALKPLAWPGAELAIDEADPRVLFAQRSWFAMPPSRLAVFLHQRPLRPVPAVSMIHDTITLRYSPRAQRLARRVYLRRAAAMSKVIVTATEYARRCIQRDLGVSAERIVVIPNPLDVEAAARLTARRRATDQEDFALFMGRFAPHKNLDRLVAAFERTRFCADGGRLVLAGATPEDAQRVRAGLSERQRAVVDVRGWHDQDHLDRLMASARFLVQPSLEEGYGLPVIEAAACGLPVCVSDGGSLPEITRGAVEPFSATSVEDMARALDRCAATAGDREATARVAEQILRPVPTIGEYARRFRRLVEDNLPAW